MRDIRGTGLVERLIDFLAAPFAPLFEDAPAPRLVRVERDPDPREIARRRAARVADRY